MKSMRYTPVIAFAFIVLLAGCDAGISDGPARVPPRPPLEPLVWDQDNWDEVVWQ